MPLIDLSLQIVTLGKQVAVLRCELGDDLVGAGPERFGVYTGAGTVLRDDVPAGALAVSSTKQRNIEGWVQRKRPGTPPARAAEAALANSTDGNTEHKDGEK